ncbi:MAG: hypothetical protein R3C49_06925 [Planctomycetaceae bacterium]
MLVMIPLQTLFRSNRCCATVVVLVNCLMFLGCATGGYQFGDARQYRTSRELAACTGPQIERGRPNVVIDSIGWVWGIPNKILLFNHRVENHRIDAQTEAAIAEYLDQNQLNTVKVRLNQYHPGDDWRRLVANKSVGPGWRYTLGTLSVLGETVLPGRVFGGDHYNPFTNTIHVYSGLPAIAVHEGGHAKDFAGRKWKGTYAAAYLIPGIPLYHESLATRDALDYFAVSGNSQNLKQAYEVLYPAYGSYVGNVLSGTIPFGYVGGIIGGHIAGRYQSYQVRPESMNRYAASEKDVENFPSVLPAGYQEEQN